VGFILLFTNLIIVIFIHNIPDNYRCPNCNSKEFVDYGETIECVHCGSEFFKKFLNSEIDEDNLLSNQELNALANVFHKELQNEEHRERFFKSLDKDLEENDED
jgi:DNA-directed RNA polymerase subunit RPC12/RpoP